MFHPEPEGLALGALEGYPEEVRRHLAECAECAAEVESLRRVVDAGRATVQPVVGPLDRPADAVWDRVAEELGLAQAAAGAEPAVQSRPDTQPPAAGPVSPARRRWRRTTAWVAAAALVIGAMGAVVVQRLLNRPDAAVVATAELAPLPGWDAAGSAEVETEGDQRVLVVDLSADVTQGYLEVWLISSDLERLVSLGVLTDGRGRFDLPPDIDLSDFAIVDVSAEPLDGDPAHSGDSVVRGELA